MEFNNLFDPIKYFGGLNVVDLNEKNFDTDHRLSDMFKQVPVAIPEGNTLNKHESIIEIYNNIF